MKLLRLPTAKVQLGVPLPWNVRDANSKLLLSKGHIVTSQSQLDTLLERGAFVDLEEAKAAERLLVSTVDTSVTKRPPNLFGIWDQLPNEMRKLTESWRDATDIAASVITFVQSIVSLVDQDVDIALYHTVRQENADLYFYGYSHSIHTAVLCLLMARKLAWSEQRTRSLMCAALTMNLSILTLQGQLAKQETPLRDSQRELIRKHPQETYDWLVKAQVSDPEWLAAVAQHHERSDGSGYCQGITNIADIAVALRVTDVFMAKISRRTMRSAMGIKDAAKQLYTEDHGGPMSTAIIKEFGIFPPGEVVKLASGEIAIVMRRTASAKCPIVATIADAAGRAVTRSVQRDTAQPEHAIVGSTSAPTDIARLPPERIYGYAQVSSQRDAQPTT